MNSKIDINLLEYLVLLIFDRHHIFRTPATNYRCY